MSWENHSFSSSNFQHIIKDKMVGKDTSRLEVMYSGTERFPFPLFSWSYLPQSAKLTLRE